MPASISWSWRLLHECGNKGFYEKARKESGLGDVLYICSETDLLRANITFESHTGDRWGLEKRCIEPNCSFVTLHLVRVSMLPTKFYNSVIVRKCQTVLPYSG
jgi:hypothetical protein